ncbi:hypothetical protein FB45DRAFT_1053619 [Roridomyces roridus]|uniref:Uncharacterized protein n=1 Tax=Roridomyces roridus TaxID=1738132 RepID=A0AAD7C6X8_9AGAR|nr:hypothetical protein FB45DRAFT_1053619 [Roridomyces roridus]
MPSNTDAYIYHVMRHTDDHHNGGSDTQVRGMYTTLKEANAAARVEEDDEGMVSVEAECPEGEMMSVYIEKKKAPKGLTKAPTSKPKAKTSAEKPAAPKDVWVIMQTDYVHHTDEKGRSHLASSDAYGSLLEANEAGRSILCETCGFEEDDDELEDIEMNEENIGSTTKRYVGYAYIQEDQRDHVKVEVQKLGFRPAPTKQSKGSKKRKIEEVIDISSD